MEMIGFDEFDDENGRLFKIEMYLNWWDSFMTAKCINHPDRDAVVFSGHLKIDEGVVTAGFCSCECHDSVKSDRDGCFGCWRPEFGLKYRDHRDEF